MFLTVWKTSLACKRVSKFVGRGVPRAKAPAPLTVWFSRAVLHRLRARAQTAKVPIDPIFANFCPLRQIHRAQWQKTETTEKRRKNRKRSGENGERSGESGERSGESGERSGESGERSGESGERSGESGERGKQPGKRRKKRGKTWNLNFGIFVLKSQPKMSKTQFFREIVANSAKNAFGAESGLFRANLLRCALKLGTDKFLPIFWRNCGVSS